MNERLPLDHDARVRVTTDLDQTILVEAAAGTGKTTLLIERILGLVEKKNTSLSRVVAITFTEKAAGELKIRLRGKLEEKIRGPIENDKYKAALRDLDQMPVGTIHGFCAELIRQMPVEAGVDPAFTVADEEMEQDLRNEFWTDWITEQLSTECAAIEPFLKEDVPLTSANGFGSSLRDLFDYMSRNSDVLEIFYVADSEEAQALADWMKAGVRKYRERKLERGYLGFQDLLTTARDVLKNSEEARRIQRDRYDYLLIDEFQDTDPLQTEIIFFLAGIGNSSEWVKTELNPGRLFLVGDPKQSIYRFRRADLKLYGQVKKRFSDIGRVETISLNFRSLAAILDEVNAVFGPAMTGSEDGGFEPAYVPLQAHREQNGLPSVQLLTPPTDYHQQKYDSETAARLEAAGIAEHILRLLRENKFRPSEIAILFRSTTHLETLTAELRARDIPFETSNAKSFTKRSEVQALRAVLGALDNPADEVQVVGALRSPFFACSDDDILMHRLQGGRFNFLEDKIETGSIADSFELLKQFYNEKSAIPVSQLILSILDQSGVLPVFALKPQGETRIQNLYRLVSAARRLEKQSGPSLYRFVRWIDSLESLRGQSEADIAEVESEAVHLSTFHKAKGLEFPAVFLYRLFQKDSFTDCIFHDRDTAELNFKFKELQTKNYKFARDFEINHSKEELARMLYVAMTRAKELLVLPVHWQATNLSIIREMLSARYPLTEGVVTVPNSDAVKIISTDDFDLRKPRREKMRLSFSTEMNQQSMDLVQSKSQWHERLSSAAKNLDYSKQFSTASAQELAFQRQQEVEFVANTPALTFGSIVHRILETITLPGGDNLESIIGRKKKKGIISAASLDEAQTLIQRAIGSSFLVGKLAWAEKIYRELPYAAELDGVIYEGCMDLVFVKNRHALIVDYKTDRIEAGTLSAAAERYRAQARIYAKALQKILGSEAPDVALFFLRDCEVHLFRGNEL